MRLRLSIALLSFFFESISFAGTDRPGITDQASLLYSSQVHFDSEGIPLVTVGVMEDCKRIGISSDQTLVLSVIRSDEKEAKQDIRILPGQEWMFELDKHSSGKVTYWVGVDSVAFGEKNQLKSTIKSWRERGHEPQVFEVGSVFGLRGHVIDNRAYVVGINPQETERQADQEAARIFSQFGVKAFKHAYLRNRPTGTIRILDQKGQLAVSARDLVTVSAIGGSGWVVIDDIESVNQTEWRGQKKRKYAGEVLLTVGHSGGLVAINRISSERILEGLVPAEMFASAPIEALKAQAVVARGEVFAKIGSRHFLDPYLLCASTHCQVYAGVSVEHPRTRKAIHATRGELLFRDSKLVDSVYSASCGGHTENNEVVWSGLANPGLRGKPDMPVEFVSQWASVNKRLGDWLRSSPQAFCNISSYSGQQLFRWTHTISSSEMDRLASKVKPVGQVVSIQVLSRGVSGRASLLRVVGTKEEFLVRQELPIRRFLGGLKSAMFHVEVVLDEDQMPSAFRFRGGGWGHGVGMCQMGAIGMAELKYNYRQILKHYYQGAEIFQLYGKSKQDDD